MSKPNVHCIWEEKMPGTGLAYHLHIGKQKLLAHGQCYLTVVRVCAYTQVVRRAHTGKLSAHINISFRTVFAPMSYTSLQIQLSSGKIVHKRYFMPTQTLKN